MKGFLLDTNVVSELVSVSPSPKVTSWLASVDEPLLYLSALTIGEIRNGIEELAQGRKRTKLESWIASDLVPRFSGRILPIDLAVADRWGAMTAASRRSGRPLPLMDSLLAATALEYDLTIASRNVADFAGTPVAVLNPWF